MTHPLLTPRYMVEADYPNSPFRVGDVLTFGYGKYTSIKNVSINECDVSHYPHIFRPMHWSELRELGEMPRWVVARFLTTPRIYHVEYSLIGDYIFIRVVGDESWLDIETACNDWKLTPATESEYLEYLKPKEK